MSAIHALPPFRPIPLRPAAPGAALPAGMKPHAEMVRVTAPAVRFTAACLVAASAWLLPVALLFWLAT